MKSFDKLCKYFKQLIEGTQWENHLFVVGGACRDMVMGRPIHDMDLTVDLPLGSVKFAKWLKTRKLVIGSPTIFEKYSTARLRLKAFPHDEIEIVQTRSDSYGAHNSHDPALAFGTLTDDCTRRDLTINSLYYDISNEELLDLCGQSRQDIADHIIRTPSSPEHTFSDDPLRMLRCVRFAADLGWEIAPEAWEEICRRPADIRQASIERIRNEFDKALACANPRRALELMKDSGLLQVVIPEIAATYELKQNKYHLPTVWDQSLATISNLSKHTREPHILLAGLLCDIAKPVVAKEIGNGEHSFHGHEKRGPAMARHIMTALRYEPALIKEAEFIVRHHMAAKSWGHKAERMTDADLRRLQYAAGSQSLLDRLLSVIHADNMAAPKRNRMPLQVPEIRRRLAELNRKGRSMYSYKLPLDSPRIRRLLHIPAGPKVDECKAFLLQQAFINPKLTPDECRELLRREFGSKNEYSAVGTATGRSARSARSARNRG